MTLDQFAQRLDDAVNALERIALALEELNNQAVSPAEELLELEGLAPLPPRRLHPQFWG